MTRNKNIKIRLSEDELRRLKRIAGARGVSSLLRTKALGPDRRIIQAEKFSVVAELARARNVLNQIARNCQRQPTLAVMQIVSQLVAVERQLSNLKKK
jgi:hypothetical protein